MNRNSLWIMIVIVAAWIGFLLGYAVSSHTGATQARSAPPAPEQAPPSGGYGR